MKNIYSNIFSFNKKTLHKSIVSLKKGNVIGLPTETVYGLAGNAYSKIAVQKIYKLKKRPKKKARLKNHHLLNKNLKHKPKKQKKLAKSNLKLYK